MEDMYLNDITCEKRYKINDKDAIIIYSNKKTFNERECIMIEQGNNEYRLNNNNNNLLIENNNDNDNIIDLIKNISKGLISIQTFEKDYIDNIKKLSLNQKT